MLPAHRIKCLVLPLLATAAFCLAAAEPPGRRPSLDALVTRASAYWELLAKGQKDRALEYVQPPSREAYLARQTPAFSDPRVIGLELSAAPAEVWVTVKVKRVLPLIPGPVDWPVKEKWAFDGGKWLVVIAKLPSTFAPATSSQPRIPAANPEETDKERQSIGEALHFENSKIDFGTVRQGQEVPIELKYQLTGNKAMAWKVRGGPRGLMRRGSGGKELVSGEGQKIELRLLTQDHDGEISATFAVLAGSAGVEVPYEFTIHGYVYAPVSISPRALRFLKGESAKEVTLRNNSKSALQIIPVREMGFDVQPLPQTIAPGGECRLTVKLKLKGIQANHREDIDLRFAEPVDGMLSIGLPVIVNYEEPKVWQPNDPWAQPAGARKPPR